MSPKGPDTSHTPGALDAVMQDAANAAPAPSAGESVPVTVAPTTESTATPATDVAPTEPAGAPAMAPGSMVSPGQGFDLGDTHTIQATTPFTENNPDAATELNGGPAPIPAPEPQSAPAPTPAPAPSVIGPAEAEIPAVNTTPSAETTATRLAPEPESNPPVTPSIPVVDKPFVAGPDGKPTGSQVLGEGDTLVVDSPEKHEKQEFQQWVANAKEGLIKILDKESRDGALSPDDLSRKALFLAVVQADHEQNKN